MSDKINNGSEIFMDAVCKKIHDDAYREGFMAGCANGQSVAGIAIMTAFDRACSVDKVIYNGMKTIVRFKDGDKAIVTYNPEYGYPYDPEKAIMAAMLKHLTGNAYIKPLKKYGYRTDAGISAARNVSDTMIKRGLANTEYEYEDENTGSAFDVDAEGNAVNPSSDEKLLKEFREMNSEIDLG